MKAKELDVVRLIKDLPNYSLKAGETLTIVDATEFPNERYILEMDNEEKQVITDHISPEYFYVIKEFK